MYASKYVCNCEQKHMFVCILYSTTYVSMHSGGGIVYSLFLVHMKVMSMRGLLQ